MQFKFDPFVPLIKSNLLKYIYDLQIIGMTLSCAIFCLVIKVPESGKYTFYVACSAACKLWLDMNQIVNQDKARERILLAELDAQHWTYHNQWER